ncbi:hypothetical protein DFJ74DRAFT_673657 [Hyaloraphidium curvatum]|nr:hypothetical protein DFJ74DRAFT_673657 [Hyaloraphidium curvatum]
MGSAEAAARPAAANPPPAGAAPPAPEEQPAAPPADDAASDGFADDAEPEEDAPPPTPLPIPVPLPTGWSASLDEVSGEWFFVDPSGESTWDDPRAEEIESLIVMLGEAGIGSPERIEAKKEDVGRLEAEVEAAATQGDESKLEGLRANLEKAERRLQMETLAVEAKRMTALGGAKKGAEDGKPASDATGSTPPAAPSATPAAPPASPPVAPPADPPATPPAAPASASQPEAAEPSHLTPPDPSISHQTPKEEAPLPAGWTKNYDKKSSRWFFTDKNKAPPLITWQVTSICLVQCKELTRSTGTIRGPRSWKQSPARNPAPRRTRPRTTANPSRLRPPSPATLRRPRASLPPHPIYLPR